MACRQRFRPRQCRQDFGGVAVQQGRDGQLEAREDAAVQHALLVRQLRAVVVLFQAEPFQAGFGHQPDQVFAHAVAAVGPPFVPQVNRGGLI